jgi:hypothetical protein
MGKAHGIQASLYLVDRRGHCVCITLHRSETEDVVDQHILLGGHREPSFEGVVEPECAVRLENLVCDQGRGVPVGHTHLTYVPGSSQRVLKVAKEIHRLGHVRSDELAEQVQAPGSLLEVGEERRLVDAGEIGDHPSLIGDQPFVTGLESLLLSGED